MAVEPPHVTLHIDLTTKDFFTYHLWSYQRNPLLYAFLALLAFLVWLWWDDTSLAHAALVGASMALLLAVGPLNIVRAYELSMHQQRFWAAQGGVNIALTPEGIHLAHRHGESHTKWTGIRAVRMVMGVIVFEVHQSAAVVLPLRELGKEDVEKVRELSIAALGPEKVTWRRHA